MGGGWQRITKIHGAIILNGERYVWDYHNDVGIHEREMPKGSERWTLSERAKFRLLQQELDDAHDAASCDSPEEKK